MKMKMLEREYYMPLKIPDNLPAFDVLQSENIFVMDENRAFHQDIRPLKILIFNIMPTKIVTETQILRLISNTPIQVEVILLHPSSYISKNTPKEHLALFYKTFDDVKDEKFDGLIITGAPVEKIPFEEVLYWEELKKLFEWSKTNVTSTLHICWGAQAGLYYHYGINKHNLDQKLSGIYKHKATKKYVKLLRGFDDEFYVPHSRYTEIKKEDIKKHKEIEILSESETSGVHIVASKDGKQIFVTGHSEYDPDTLKIEFERDVAKGINVNIPVNYFKDDDPTKKPIVSWRGHANLLFSNWLNYYVYQETPYDLVEEI